jgi:hypothetical protein
MLGLVSVAYAILFLQRSHGLTQGLEDAVKWEAKHAFNEKAQACREREQARKANHRVAKWRWVHTSWIWVFGEGEEEGGCSSASSILPAHNSSPAW